MASSNDEWIGNASGGNNISNIFLDSPIVPIKRIIGVEQVDRTANIAVVFRNGETREGANFIPQLDGSDHIFQLFPSKKTLPLFLYSSPPYLKIFIRREGLS